MEMVMRQRASHRKVSPAPQEACQIDRALLTVYEDRLLGRGAFGYVLYGRLQDNSNTRRSASYKEVAVKEAHSKAFFLQRTILQLIAVTVTGNTEQSLLHEIDVMARLGQYAFVVQIQLYSSSTGTTTSCCSLAG